jgi:1-acyl-sn-glycerol-3-phosphate acyltransferase
MRLRDEAEIAAVLTALSTAEIVSALGAPGLLSVLRRAVERVARAPSRRLGDTLAQFDALIGRVGITQAAGAALASFGARLEVEGEVGRSGPLLVVTNHPGAYDALAMLAALRRDDVALVAADRAFLRAMPALGRHLVFVDDTRSFDRLAGLRRALAWLADGRALVQFGAGAIEPDARFVTNGGDLLGAWLEGTGVLASRAAALEAAVVPAFVSGVHSRRAKRLPIVRWAERRGVTTVAPLIQATVPGFRDVVVSVRIGAAIPRSAIDAAATNAERTKVLRAAVEALGTPSRMPAA